MNNNSLKHQDDSMNLSNENYVRLEMQALANNKKDDDEYLNANSNGKEIGSDGKLMVSDNASTNSGGGTIRKRN
jgi:hypothetical protein